MTVFASGAISKIAQQLPQHRKIKFDILVRDGDVIKELIIDCMQNGQKIEVVLRDAPTYTAGPSAFVPSLAAAFAKARELVGDMTPIMETCGDGDIRAAWCETFGITPNSFTSMTAEQVREYTKSEVRKSLLTLLDRGGEAVKLWNARPNGEKIDSKIDFTKMNHSGKDLSGIDLQNLDLSASNFDNCQLSSATLNHSECSKSTFRNANLEKSNISGMNAGRVDFSAACLKNIFCHGGNFKNANFKGADLTGSKIREGDIRGADFTNCTTSGAIFENVKYDEKTKLPADFPLNSLVWKGTGVDPRRETELKEALSTGVTDYAGFIEQIDKNFDSDRIEKALKMLKKERFQLFSQITPDQVIGVVRSQSDQELVYSCMLTEEGKFTCCTQNLKPCGGLKGALCKHLLVLIIGLTKSEALGPNQSATWVLNSKFHQPKIDKDMMSSIFLQYKGALMGEFDWRPTETIPEDYYT